MRITEYALEHRVVMIFAIALIFAGGIFAYGNLGKLEDPEFTIKDALVITSWPGATPHEMELHVTDVIEQAVQATDELDEIESYSRAGVSVVKVKLKQSNRSGDMPQLWDTLRRKVGDCQGDLPAGAGPSLVWDDYGDVYGIFLGVTGDGFDHAELEEYVDFLQRELSLVPDVARVSVWGDRTEVVEVVPSRARMASFGVNPGMIAAVLNRQNTVVRTGSIDVGDSRIRLRPTGVFGSLDEIGELVIPGAPGEQVLLRDVAVVRRAYLDPPSRIMRCDGEPALGLGVSVVSGGDMVALGEAVDARLAELEAELPVGIDFVKIYDQPARVVDSISQFIWNLVMSVAIVIGVLLLAMGLRSGLLIGSGLVLSILGTLIFMLIWGVSMQRTSLGAFIIAMGMLVDNAIVVTDGALVGMQRGLDGRRAAVDAARRTAVPLLGATLVAALAFLPIYLSPDNSGEYVASLFIVVGVSLLLSWILAITQTPLACTMFLKIPAGGTGDPYGGRFYVAYRRFLETALRRRARVAILMAVVLALAAAGFTKVGREFFPPSSKPMVMVDFWLPEGSDIRTVSERMRDLEAFVARQPETVNTALCIGGPPPRYYLAMNSEDATPSYGQLIVNVGDFKEARVLKPRIEDWLAGNRPDALVNVFLHKMGPPAKAAVEAAFIGPDPAVLRDLAAQAEDLMRADPHARSVRTDWRERTLMLEPRYDQPRGMRAGVSRADVATSLSRLTEGTPVGWFREKDDQLPILLKADADERSAVGDLSAAPVWGSVAAAATPLGQVAPELSLAWEDPIIRRFDRRRAITAQCESEGISGTELQARLRSDIEAIPLPEGYGLKWFGSYRNSVRSNAAVTKFLPLALLLMTFIIVAIFDSLRKPLIIALTLPLSIVGIVIGLLLTGVPFGFMALLGSLSLIGMLIKNAVVLIDEIDAGIAGGAAPWTAVLDASVSRLRPVMMASMTTVLGMFPLLWDPLFQGLAVTIMFGLTFATVLTLLVVPVLYTLLFRVRPEV